MLEPDITLQQETQTVLNLAKTQSLKLCCAESCTGGLIAALLTSISGASEVFTYGIVTYSNESKMQLVNVPEAQLIEHGAVSESVACSMAEGARLVGPADISVAVTGVAGPNGGTPDKPVGLVHIAVARAGHETTHSRNLFSGNRDDIRTATVRKAIDMLKNSLAKST